MRDGDGVRPDRDDEARRRDGCRRCWRSALGILAASRFGLLNGGLVTGLSLPPFIVTLGTLNIAFALTHIYSNDQTFSELPSAAPFFGPDVHDRAAPSFTYGVVLMFVLYAVAWYALTQTAWGRHVYAVGDNPEAARLTGIKTNRVLLGVYTLAGLVYGIAAMLLVSPHRARRPERGPADGEPRRITAVVLGGTSLFGGRGT